MTAERFTDLLERIRRDATALSSDLLVENIRTGRSQHALLDDSLSVALASEIALAMLIPGLVPSQEAVNAAENVLDRRRRLNLER